MPLNTYNYIDKYEKDLFSMLHESYDLQKFMLCSPYSTDPILNYGGILSKNYSEAFLKHLYIEGRKNVEENIIHDICSGGKSTLKIVGNKGCGKTTLIHKLSKVLESKDQRALILDFGDQHATLRYDFATDSVVQKIYERLVEDKKINNCQMIRWMVELYSEIEGLIDRKWDANHKIDCIFKKLNSLIIDIKNNREDQLKSIRDDLYTMELYQLIFIFLLSDINKNIENKRTTIFLDNLDNMVDHGDIREILKQYDNFLNGIGSLYDKIRNYLKTEYGYRYVFVFVLRDSTVSYLTHHEYAIRQITDQEYDVTKHYSKKDIALKRIEVFAKFSNSFSRDFNYDRGVTYSKILELLKNILNDSYVTDTIFDIFNNDYRICMMTMIKIASSGQLTNDVYEDIKKSGSMHGSRGVIYRLLFNNFYVKGYFKRIRITDFKNRGIEPSSPSRLLLTYIANSTDVELSHDSRVVSFDDLLDDVGNEIEGHDIIRCLWEMYNLATADDWCNLISFAESNEATERGLCKEHKNYIDRKAGETFENIEYSTFRITTAGIAFLTYACVHFEFFACRSMGTSYPALFLPKAFKEIDGEYMFKTIIDSVLEEVRTCASKLSESYESDSGLCSESNSTFIFKRPEKSGQYHIERLVFSHIQYLDEFRRFALRKKEEKVAHIVSDYVLMKIEEYLNLINDNKIKCSKYGKDVVFALLLGLFEEAKADPYNPEKEIGRKNELFM